MRVTVTTELVNEQTGQLLLNIPVVVPNASQDLVDWLAGSCKTTLFKFIDAPQADIGWTIRYRTTVHDGDKEVLDTGWAEFDRLSDETAAEFQAWALEELSVMLDKVREGTHSKGQRAKVTRWRMLWKLVFGRKRS